jgi:hypothetical protein
MIMRWKLSASGPPLAPGVTSPYSDQPSQLHTSCFKRIKFPPFSSSHLPQKGDKMLLYAPELGQHRKAERQHKIPPYEKRKGDRAGEAHLKNQAHF